MKNNSPLLLLLVAHAAAQNLVPDGMVKDIQHVFNASRGVPENRIGFAFASLCLASEDGSDVPIPGSQARLAAVADVLAKYPKSRLLVEGHVGVAAPDEIAQSYSEHRSHVVAMLLEQHFGVDGDRLMTRGWGKDITEAAQQSSVRQHAPPLYLSLRPTLLDRRPKRPPR